MTTTDAAPAGVLPVAKPPGPTSHDIVATARRALRLRRIGHTGTLDPFASGLLLLCLGPATRLAEYLSGMDKRYTATVRFGITTDTDDHTGTVTAESDPGRLTPDEVEHALAAQRGAILQTPPAYSAKKVGGERAYRSAREGRAVALEPVSVRIHELRLTAFTPPFAELDVHCSSGTYIRAIARDLGAALGTGAHLSVLRRTAIGPFDVAAALPLDALGDPDRVRTALIAPLDALAGMPRLDLTGEDAERIRHGRQLTADVPDAPVIALAAAGRLVAIASSADGVVRPRKVFA